MDYANSAIKPGMDALMSRQAEADADPTRPIYHFTPPSGWMNDVNGPLFHKGEYHLFYQVNPYGTDARHGTHWGHTSSTNLAHWERLPLAVPPANDLGESACYSGTAGFNNQGQPIILYTSTRKWDEGPGSNSRRAAEPFEQCAAIGNSNLMTWDRHPRNPILTLESDGYPDWDWKWRDPFIFREAGRTFLVIGMTGVGTPIYEDEVGDLVSWTYRGKLTDIDVECPNFFRLGDKWVLLTSSWTAVEYHIGDFDIGTYKFIPAEKGQLEPARTFYGTNVLIEDDGRCLLFGRLLRTIPSMIWNGCMALPRELTIGSDGHPKQSPVSEVEVLRGTHLSVPPLELASESKVLEARGDALEIYAKIVPGDADLSGLRLRRSDDGKDAVTVAYDHSSVIAAGIDMPHTLPAGRQELELRIFLDKSVIEVFVDGGSKALTNYIDPGINNLGIELFSQGGSATFKGIDIWEMEPIR